MCTDVHLTKDVKKVSTLIGQVVYNQRHTVFFFVFIFIIHLLISVNV